VRWAKGHLIRGDKLYHRSTSGMLQRCIPIEEGKALLLDIHDIWAPCFIKEQGWKSLLARFLLANDYRQCGSDHEVLQGVTIL
jgi:hypothetical protein